MIYCIYIYLLYIYIYIDWFYQIFTLHQWGLFMALVDIVRTAIGFVTLYLYIYVCVFSTGLQIISLCYHVLTLIHHVVDR